MMIISREISQSLAFNSKYGFAGLSLFGKKRDKAKLDIPKFDVVVVGGHLGGLFARHLDEIVKQKATTFVAYEKATYDFHPIRTFYENGLITKFNMEGSTKKSINQYIATSEGQAVVQIIPGENTVVLKNGRKIQYDQLVVANGLRSQLNIPGLEDAWSDPSYHFHCSIDHPTWKSSVVKPQRFIHNFTGGQAIFYIPPYPFHTEVESYNFLVAKQVWDRAAKTGLISWGNSRFTVINANDKFCQFYDKGDTFIKSQLESNNINVEYGLKLVQVKKDTNTAVFQNLKTGETQQRYFNNFYNVVGAKPDQLISNAGLGDANGYLDVDPQTLQHKKYANIFGFGDTANTPTTKTFWGSFNQLSVVRHNVERQLKGLSANAKYDGTSSANMFVGIEKVATFSHTYDGKPVGSLDSGFFSSLKYKYAKRGMNDISKLLQFKSWGAPYYKWPKKFDGANEQGVKAAQLHPQPKKA